MPGGVQPPWKNESRLHSFTRAIYEPINSVSNLPTNCQAPVIPAQDPHSTPGPIGIIPNMGALSRAASSAFNYSSSPDSLPPAYRPDPVERFPTSYFGASPAPPLGDNGQMDHDDFEARAPEPLAFKSMTLYQLPDANLSSSSQDDSTDANHLVSRANRKRRRPQAEATALATYGSTTSQRSAFQKLYGRRKVRVSQRPVPDIVLDRVRELVLEMDESPSRSTQSVSPRTSLQALRLPPPGAPPPDPLKRLFPCGSVTFSESDDGEVDDAMANEASAPVLPVFQPEDQSYSSIPGSSSELTESYEEVYKGRKSSKRRNTADNERGRLLRASGLSSPAWRIPFKHGVSRMQLASVRQRPVPSGPRPMVVTPYPANPVIARRLRVRKNEERGDDRPQEMNMQLQFDSYPQLIPVRSMCSINL